MENTVQITIASCDKCPEVAIRRHYTADSFEHVMKWECKKSDMKHIAFNEWNDPTPPIPKWCLLRKV